MSAHDIFRIYFDSDWSLHVDVSPWLILGFIVIVVYLAVRFGTRYSRFEVVEANVQLGGIGNLKIKPSYLDVQIAHKAWTELMTRKAGLRIDAEHDVIVEVYDSWYALFARIRELIQEIPAQQIRSSPDTRRLVEVLVLALNEGLRPHLTKWQAQFRRWYQSELDSAKSEETPQQVQRRYPRFTELITDLDVVNTQLIQYAAVLKHIAQGK